MATGGAFDIGFASLPLVFERIPLGHYFGFMWFLLLFFAGITSSVAMGQPLVAFLEDEFKFSRKQAVGILAMVVFLAVHLVVFYLKFGFLDEMDYWAGTFGLVVFALIETVLFIWVFGPEKAWAEINDGGDIKIPRVFFYLMKFVTPVVLFGIMIWWFINDAIPILFLTNTPPDNVPYVWGARLLLVAIYIALALMVRKAWQLKVMIFLWFLSVLFMSFLQKQLPE